MPREPDQFQKVVPPLQPLATTRAAFDPNAEPLQKIQRKPQAVTKRALVIGLSLVAFIALFTPYNDYVIQNSPFIGNHFPIGVLSIMAIIILVVNPLLIRRHKSPLRPGELVTIMTMMLVSCAVPSSGLMRYLEPMLVSPFYLVRDYPWLRSIVAMLPSWLVPTTDSNSPIITNYWLGLDPRQTGGGQVPIVAFLLPKLLWFFLIGSLFGMALYLAAIFRKQWVQHERLSYPLATIPLDLIAAPEAGRCYNRMWRNGVLWAGIAIPAMVYLLTGLHDFYPGVPYVKLEYDFRAAFTEKPWDALPPYVTSARLFLAVVGIAFFVPSEIAFSLWLFLLLNAAWRVVHAQMPGFIPDPLPNEPQRAMGIYIGYFGGLLFIARNHLKHVVVSAIQNRPREEAEFASYRTMVVGFAVCFVIAWVWLVLAGMQVLVAALLLGLGAMLIVLMSRIVAETGLFFVGPSFWPPQMIAALVGPKLVSAASYYWSQIVGRVFFADLRETLMPYATNSLRMGSEAPPDERPKLFKWLFVGLFLAVLLAGGAHHYISYTHGRATLDPWASNQMPFDAMQQTHAFANTPAATDGFTAWRNAGYGATAVGASMVCRMLFVWWPFHPIGLLLMNAWPLQVFWFSIYIGWLLKQLMLRYGGAPVFKRAKPFFIGLIVGEMLSAGVWMLLGLLSGGDIKFVLLPG